VKEYKNDKIREPGIVRYRTNGVWGEGWDNNREAENLKYCTP
jgi:hypothetical protein